MSDWTDAEQAAIEQAAADHLEFNFAPSDAREIAYDIADTIRASITAATYNEAVEALDHLAGCGSPTPVSDDWLAGASAAHDRVVELRTEAGEDQ